MSDETQFCETQYCLTELVPEGTSDVIAQIASPITFNVGDIVSVSNGDWKVVDRKFVLMPGNGYPLGAICYISRV